MALDIEEVSTEDVRVRTPFNPELCVDSDQTPLHGGILTALLNAGSIWFDGHEEAEIARGTASFALTRGETGLFEAMIEGKAS